MKKKLLLLLLLCMCFTTISGCGKAQEKQATETESEDEEKEDTRKKKKDKEQENTDSDAGKKDAKNKLLGLLGKEDLSPLPVIQFEQRKEQWYVPDSSNLLCEATYEMIHLDDPEYAALSEALTTYANANAETILDYAVSNVDLYYEEEYLKDIIDEYSYFTFDTSYKHTRFDHNILSIREYYSDYQLGPHGSYTFTGATFDVETGNQIMLTDLVDGDYYAFESFVREYMVNKILSSYEEELFSPSELASTINSYQLGSDIPWYLNGSGIVFIFNIYSIGPYAMGSTEVCVPYTELKDYLKEDYLPTNGTYIAELSPNTPSCYGGLVQNNNRDDAKTTDTASYQTICINTDINGEYDGGVSVSAADSEEILTDYGYFQSAYFIRKSDGNDYLLICTDLMSGDYETLLFQIDEGVLTQLNHLPGNCLVNSSVFESSFTCTSYFYVLGTYSSDLNYDWNADNTFTQKNETYDFNVGNWGKMTVQIPLPVTMNGQNTTLDVGTQIQIIGYDGDSTVFFRIVGTENTGEIKVVHEEYEYLIDGISEYDYFDFVPYAG